MSRIMHLYPSILTILVLGLWTTGCLSSSEVAVNPDDEFGHRVEGATPDGRQTIVIQPPDSARAYRYYSATVQSVNVRPAPIMSATDAAGVSVELLVKGAFPDACTELHDVQQVRTGNIVRVDLQMRRPTSAVCATVLRPYRFYVELTGRYTVGSYTVFLNDVAWPFEIRAPIDSPPRP